MKEKKKRVIVKSILCLVYLIILGILLFGSFKLYQDKEEIRPFSEIESSEEYTYITINKMSDKFYYLKEDNIGYHYTLDKDNLYIIAINENELDTYKSIMDYTNGKTKKKPDSEKVYAYPVPVEDKVKEEAIKNIKSFTDIEITEENYEEHFTNMVLDTTKEKKEDFNIILFLTLFLSFLVFVLLFLTIIDKDKIVDSMLEEEKEEIKPKKKTNKR